MMKDIERMRFMQCFDCRKVMWRLPLPPPRDHQVQHKCLHDKVKTRMFGKHMPKCSIRHTKSEQNPNGVCLVIITKAKYLLLQNDGRYAAEQLLSKSTSKSKQKKKHSVPRKKKHSVPRRFSRRRAVKARLTAKRRPVLRISNQPLRRRISREKKKVSGARKTRRSKRKQKSKKRRAKRPVKLSPKVASAIASPVNPKTHEPDTPAPLEPNTLNTLEDAIGTFSFSSKKNECKESAPNEKIECKESALEGNQATVNTGSSNNPIYLDSDEEIPVVFSERVPVDDVRIGTYCCERTRFDCPAVQCFDEVFTLYVWDKKRNGDGQRESFEVDISYSSLTYAAFSKRNKLFYCVFETSGSPLERRTNPTKSTNSSIEGEFIHNSSNYRKKSILLSSVQEDHIAQIRSGFLKYRKSLMLKPKKGQLKSTFYLKCHGINTLKPKFLRLLDLAEVDGKEEVLVYPTQGSSHGAVTLTMKDVRRLRPGKYLNDSLLDFYMRYLYREKWDESLRERVHIFNTFFFKKWIECKQRKGERDLEYDLSRWTIVRKWTKNVDIFTKEFLVIPVNYKLHWSLAIVCFPGAVLESSMKSNKRCCILGFDSMKLFRASHFDEIKRYLNMAWRNRAVKSVRHLPFTKKPAIPLEIPSQSNAVDCGVFVLHNCEMFFDTEGFSDYKSPSPGVNWYPTTDILRKRREIFDLISKKSERDLSAELAEMNRPNGKDKKTNLTK